MTLSTHLLFQFVAVELGNEEHIVHSEIQLLICPANVLIIVMRILKFFFKYGYMLHKTILTHIIII